MTDNSIIVNCRIEQSHFINFIIVSGYSGEPQILSTYYPDEVSFDSCEFLGLSMRKAYDLFEQRRATSIIAKSAQKIQSL